MMNEHKGGHMDIQGEMSNDDLKTFTEWFKKLITHKTLTYVSKEDKEVNG